ncbi:Conserved_hypothetical protein [Hexamita inflata]|uniref:Uncharacterized protein n=1 Tax=Hexamita inflata TaxID=28002 RepID=A0AA86Q1B0_9EUKA|nr:Conserved hypothetical protein [Hexamita inflata]
MSVTLIENFPCNSSNYITANSNQITVSFPQCLCTLDLANQPQFIESNVQMYLSQSKDNQTLALDSQNSLIYQFNGKQLVKQSVCDTMNQQVLLFGQLQQKAVVGTNKKISIPQIKAQVDGDFHAVCIFDQSIAAINAMNQLIIYDNNLSPKNQIQLESEYSLVGQESCPFVILYDREKLILVDSTLNRSSLYSGSNIDAVYIDFQEQELRFAVQDQQQLVIFQAVSGQSAKQIQTVKCRVNVFVFMSKFWLFQDVIGLYIDSDNCLKALRKMTVPVTNNLQQQINILQSALAYEQEQTVQPKNGFSPLQISKTYSQTAVEFSVSSTSPQQIFIRFPVQFIPFSENEFTIVNNLIQTTTPIQIKLIPTMNYFASKQYNVQFSTPNQITQDIEIEPFALFKLGSKIPGNIQSAFKATLNNKESFAKPIMNTNLMQQADFIQLQELVLESCSLCSGLEYLSFLSGISFNTLSDLAKLFESEYLTEKQINPKGFQTRIQGFVKTFQSQGLNNVQYQTGLFLKDCELLCLIQKKDFNQIKGDIIDALKVLESGFENCGKIALEMMASVFR